MFCHLGSKFFIKLYPFSNIGLVSLKSMVNVYHNYETVSMIFFLNIGLVSLNQWAMYITILNSIAAPKQSNFLYSHGHFTFYHKFSEKLFLSANQIYNICIMMQILLFSPCVTSF